jgi:hypothetical protein
MNAERILIGAGPLRSTMADPPGFHLDALQPAEFVLRADDPEKKISLQKKQLPVEHRVEQEKCAPALSS